MGYTVFVCLFVCFVPVHVMLLGFWKECMQESIYKRCAYWQWKGV